MRCELSAAKPICTVGRSSESADLCLSDDTVSRLHARFELIGDNLTLRDLGSTNKTIVSGQEIGSGPVSVSPSDKVYVGSVNVIVSRS